MNRIITIICCLTFLSIISCTSRNESSKSDYGQITLSSENVEVINPMPANNQTATGEGAYTMFLYMYVDMCIDCSLEQYPLYADFAREQGINMITLFEVTKENVKKLRYGIRSLRTNNTIVIDTAGIFIKENSSVELYSTQVFLIDKANNIIVNGNPLADKTVLERYGKEINKER